MSNIQIPYIKHSKTKLQIFDDRYKLTAFQIASFKQISELPEFSYFVCSGDGISFVRDNFGPTLCLWYDTFGNLHAHRLGKNRVLQVVVTGASVLPIAPSVNVINSRIDN